MSIEVKIVTFSPTPAHPHWRATAVLRTPALPAPCSVGYSWETTVKTQAGTREGAIRASQAKILRKLGDFVAVGELNEPIDALSFTVVDD